MVRNESVARIAMFLCFGTAILSLAVHWRVSSTQQPSGNSGSVPGSIGETAAFGASTTAGEPIRRQNHQRTKRDGIQADRQQVVVDLSDRRTYVYRGDVVIASYPIAIGKKGWETPTGSFEVMNMQHDPIWQHPITGKVFPPGDDSPLGDRWIGFWTDGRNEIGFHGTPDIHLLGTAISHGCLRMRNSDVRLLYDQVQVGTLVTVRD